MEPTGGPMRHQDVEQTTHRRVFVAQTDPASDGNHADSAGSKANSISGASENDTMSQLEDDVEDLYRSQQLAMVRLARLLTDSSALAEEIVQEAFIRFARS